MMVVYFDVLLSGAQGRSAILASRCTAISVRRQYSVFTPSFLVLHALRLHVNLNNLIEYELADLHLALWHLLHAR